MECAEANIPKKVVCQHFRPYFTPHLKTLQDKFREARSNFKSCSDEHNLNILKKCRDEYTEAYLKARQQWWNKTRESIDSRNLWQTVNKILNSHCRSTVQPIRMNNCDYAVDDKSIRHRLEEVHIHRSHIQPGTFDEDWRDEVEQKVEQLVQSELDAVYSPQYVEVELLWVAGHVDIPSSELADKAAKHTALEAAGWRQEEDQSIKTLQKVKLQIRKCVMADWQRGWDSQNEGRFTHNLYPTVSTKPMSTHFSRDVDIKLNRLQSGHTLLPSQAHKLGKSWYHKHRPVQLRK